MGSSSLNKQLFDEVRKAWVAATPEEHVRQRWLKKMIHDLHYPKELLVVEKELKELPHLARESIPNRRLDILCYAKGLHPAYPLYPLLLIECKEGPLKEGALDQVIGYNYHVKACFVAAVSWEEVLLGCYDARQKRYVFYPTLPPFKEMLQWVKPL